MMYGGKCIGAGRRKGTPNKVSVEIRALCRELTPQAVDCLEELIASPDGHVAIRAVSLVLAYAFGRPHEHVEMAEDNLPVQFPLELGPPPAMRQLEHMETQAEVR